MPIVAKVSLATALPTVRSLVGDLGRTVRDLGPLPGIDPVTNGVATLDAWCGGKALDVDVVVVSPLEVDDAGKVGAWIGKGEIRAILVRRDKMRQAIDQLVAKSSEAAVFVR